MAVVGVGLSACGASDNGGTIPVPSTSTTAGSGPATTASTIPGGG
ncbi:MAG TPA: hypothetical protein VFA11_13350 [Acidimicrobiales bacterium]|nr:hypothetical protein [Acidimicrobiales bacterium]